jgi:uncharacterized protein
VADQRGLPVAPSTGTLRPLGIADVELRGGFWGDRQQLNASTLLPHCYSWESRLGWIDNFRDPHAERGREFADSDVYKMVEGMAWEVGRSGNERLDTLIAEIAETAGGAQEDDGYLNTRFGHRGREHRYTDLEWGHELYCYGHMIQAAVARARTRGEDRLTEIARRAADHVCDTFGADGNQGVCGHPEIEMALVELYRATGEERYLEQARLFVERRGRPALADIPHGRAYFQDDMPIREASAFRGHAVRALCLASAAVDLAVETGDRELLAAIERQWEHTIARRTYLTGGMGSRHSDESFGEDYELPPDRAYSETCAGVASVQLAWRLLLATGSVRYADQIERTLFNVVATSPALDGSGFFYANPLHQRVPGEPPDPDAENMRAASSLRAPWFHVSCCPTNVARTFASLGGYVATTDADGVQIHQFASGTIRAGSLALDVQTEHPWAGEVTVRVTAAGAARRRVSLRVPEWAGEAVLVDRGHRRPVRSGYAAVDAAWQVGDELRLELPVGPRWTPPDPRVDAVRGCVAVERGPLVYCLESTDQEVDLADVRADPSAGLADQGVARDLVRAVVVAAPGLTFIPYHTWGNRGLATMRVWVPVG